MNKLTTAISDANHAYAKGMPIITDTAYDVLWQELHAIDPTNPLLYHTSKLDTATATVRHLSPIFGTQKAFNMDDMKPFLQRFGNKPLRIEPKYDGVAAMLYTDPTSQTLILHGDGHTGRDISYHLPYIYLPEITSVKTSLELIIPNHLWKSEYGKNPRNTVAGWLNRDIPDYPNGIIQAISHNGTNNFIFLYPPYSLEDLEEIFLSKYHQYAKYFPIDGLMIKLADENDRLIAANNGTVSLWSIAWKPPISTKETVVTNIEWNVSRQGKIIPTVVYDSIELCGTTNTRATGNNANWIVDKCIHQGATITVGKAGEIIPKIISVANGDKYKVAIPTSCPDCQTDLISNGTHLTCNSPNCITQLTRSLAYFYSDKGMEIKGIGEKLIWKLLQNNTLRTVLNTSPWLLLEPDDFYDRIIYKIMGNVYHKTYYYQRSTLSKAAFNPAHFIAALGYKSLAYKSALKCFQQLQGLPIRGNVPKVALTSFIKALPIFQKAKNSFKTFTFTHIPGVPTKTYCITGELSMFRNDMIAILTKSNWQFSNQVSKHVDYLIKGDISHVSTKERKAQELNVSIITESELNTLTNIGE